MKPLRKALVTKVLWVVSGLLALSGLVVLGVWGGPFGAGVAAGALIGAGLCLAAAVRRDVDGAEPALYVASVAGFLFLDVVFLIRGAEGHMQEILLGSVLAVLVASLVFCGYCAVDRAVGILSHKEEE